MPLSPISDDLQVPQIPGTLQRISSQVNAAYGVERWFFSVPGDLVAGVNVSVALPIIVDSHNLPSLLSIASCVKVAPVGSAILVDVNKNGTTVITTQANRPSIAAGSVFSTICTPDVTTLVQGDILTLDIDTIGAVTPGTYLTVTILVKQGLIII